MRSLRRLIPVICVLAFALSGQAEAQPAGHVVIVKVNGLADQTLVRFVSDAINDQKAAGAQLVILELDSSGSTSTDVYQLLDLLSDPPLPVAVWVGDAPAQAFGGSGQMLAAAPIGAAAPGVRVGYLSPAVAGSEDARRPVGPSDLHDDEVVVEQPIAGFIDFVEPALPQFVAALDGLQVAVRGEQVTLATVTETTNEEGDTVLHPVETRFLEPGLGVRVLRIGLSPDAAFFLLVMGLSVAAFEFYALGPGVAAGVAAVALVLASYGLANLPLNWWALLAALAGLAAYLAQFQRNARIGWGTFVGSALLLIGGVGLTRASPQFEPTGWITLLSVSAVAFFFIIALPAVTRARLSTPTIGRSHLIGRAGIAASDFVEGDGTAEVDGARWQAASHREAGLSRGDDLVVTGVNGTHLLVDAPPRKDS
ncbi:MAG: NfeD family protein [Acidimicrobiia bacterium]